MNCPTAVSLVMTEHMGFGKCNEKSDITNVNQCTHAAEWGNG